MATPEKLSSLALPTEDDYFTVVAGLSQELGANRDFHSGMREYVSARSTGGWYAFSTRAMGIASLVEPIDRSTGKPLDAAQPNAAAFRQGLVAGGAVTLLAHQGLIPLGRLLRSATLNYEEDDDQAQKYHEIGDDARGQGEEGLRLMGQDVEDMLSIWAERSVESADPAVERRYLAGCGFAALHGYRIHEIARRKAMQEDLELVLTDDESVWERALAELQSPTDL